MFGFHNNNMSSAGQLESAYQYAPPPSVPRAGKANKNIFSPKNFTDKVNGAVVSPARSGNRRRERVNS